MDLGALNFLSVLVSGIVAFVIGASWYGPIFGKPWMKEMGYTKAGLEKEMKEKGMAPHMITAFIANLILAVVLGIFVGGRGLGYGILGGGLISLAFSGIVILNAVLWEKKSWCLFGINISHYVTTGIVMGAIMGAWW